MPFYESGDVRIRYEEVGSGFPLLVTPGGGLNSRVSNWSAAVINAMEAFKNDFRCITMDQRNANGGESTGPIAVDDPWGAFADDQLGLMDHLGIREFFFMGYCIGGCFALKLMETCYVVAERFSSADLLHGPIAMVEASFPAFLFAPAGVTWPGIREMIEKLASLKAETLIISDPSNPEAAGHGRTVAVPVPLNELFTPIPYIIPAQLFAACLADQKGLNPDQPRTISKVTRTM